MKFLIRLILIVLAAVVIAVVGLLMLPGERIANVAATQLSKQTGREVMIGGETSISLYPTLGVTTGATRIGSADWAQDGPLLEADQLAIGVDIPALLTGTIKISTLEFIAPRIVLERAEDGRANWDLFGTDTAQASETPAAATEGADAPGSSYAISLDKAIIRDASLLYVDRLSGTRQQVSDVDLELSLPDLNGPVVFDLAATPFAERVQIAGELASVQSLMDGANTPLSATLRTGESVVTLSGALSIAPTLAVQVDATAPDAGVLVRAAGLTAEQLGLPADFAPDVTIKSDVSFDGTRLALRALQASVDGNSVSGDADVVLTEADLPTVSAQLAADLTSIGGLMRVAGQPPEQFGLDPSFDAALNSAVILSVQDGAISTQLREITARMAGSTVTGVLDFDLDAAGVPKLATTLNLDLQSAAAAMRMAGITPSGLGLDPAFDARATSAVAATVVGENMIARLTDLNASIAGADLSGTVDVAMQSGAPSAEANLMTNIPDVGALATMVGQPLSTFGLSASAAPAFAGAVKANWQSDVLGLVLTNLSASMAGASASGTLYATVTNGAPAFSGDLAASIPNTGALMQALGQSDPDIPLGFGRAITLNTTLGFDGKTLQFPKLSVQLDQNALTGAASVTLNDIPYVYATLNSGGLDLSALTGGDSSASASSGPAGWPKDPIDASALGLINGQITLASNSVNLGMMQLGSTTITTTIDRSRAVLDLGYVAVFGGGVSGQLIANSRSGLSVAGNLNASSIDLRTMLITLAGIDKISGAALTSVNFLGSGYSVDAIMRSLSGAVSMQVPSGAVAGVDLEGLIRQGNASASQTAFTNVAAYGQISGGVLRNTDLTAQTGRVDAKGQGYVDLGNQTIDYLLTPQVKEVGTQDTVALPVRIKGPWSAPVIRPDLEAALNLENERKKLEEQARQEIEREKQKLVDKARAEAEAAANRAAQRAAERAAQQLGLDTSQQQSVQDAARKALENEVGKGLRNLLGGN